MPKKQTYLSPCVFWLIAFLIIYLLHIQILTKIYNNVIVLNLENALKMFFDEMHSRNIYNYEVACSQSSRGTEMNFRSIQQKVQGTIWSSRRL